jgi:endoglucanase
MELKKHLIELSDIPGVSGYEAAVRQYIQSSWESLTDAMEIDRSGNLIATRYGSGPEPRRRILITAHMDEIGLMVTKLDGSFLRVTSVGGIDRRVLLSMPVLVHGKRVLPGIIGSRPPHILSAADRDSYPDYDDLVIDTGLPERELEKLVSIGTLVTFDQKAAEMGTGNICGKALDNRVSIATLTALLDGLRGRTHTWDVLAAATVKEEYGLTGGTTVAWHTRPDLALVLDTTWGIGVGVGSDRGFSLGDGATLLIGPNAHPGLFARIQQKAETLEIPLKPEPIAGHSGTEGWAIQVSREGVPTAIFGIPIRNMHTPVEIVSIRDIERLVRLLVEVIVDLDAETLPSLALDAHG